MEILKISSKSNPNSVAGAIAGLVKEENRAEMQAIGAGALNQAVKALGNLAEGKKLVGIISHVSELKDRIDKKIVITKNRSGERVGSSITVLGDYSADGVSVFM